MSSRFRSVQPLWYAVAVLVLAGGFVFWLSDLTTDPPMNYSGLGQSLSTDPAQYVFHAGNQIEFGEFDPFDYARWTVYQHSLVSLVALVVFSLSGVSMANAAIVGIVLVFAALVLIGAGIGRHHSAWVVAAVMTVCITNVTLYTYGQLSYLENGLLFITAALFALYCWRSDRLWAAIVCGALASGAMLTGKLFGALLLPALCVSLYFDGQNRRLFRIGLVVLSFCITSVLLSISVFGADFGAAFGYLSEQSYGLRGFPDGLSSPWAFAEHLFGYGFSNRLFYLNPDLLLFGATGALTLLMRRGAEPTERISPAVRLSGFIVLFGLIGLAPLNYSPIRYAQFLIPFFAVLSFASLHSALNRRTATPLPLDRLSLSAVFAVLWALSFHLIGNMFYFNVMPPPVRKICWLAFAVALGLTACYWQMSRIVTIKPGKRVLIGVTLALIVLSVTVNGFRLKRTHIDENNYNLLEANEDMAMILGQDAVVSGPYGPALTLNNHLRSFIHLFGVASVDTMLFTRYPITHLAVDASNWQQASRDYPALAKAQPVTTYWIRDVEIGVYSIGPLFGKTEAAAYKPTLFEQASSLYMAGNADSAGRTVAQFLKGHPDSKSGRMLLVQTLLELGKTEPAKQIMVLLAADFPTDFNIQLQCGRLLQVLALQSGDRNLLSRSQSYYAQSAKVNPFKADLANRSFVQILQQYGQPAPPQTP